MGRKAIPVEPKDCLHCQKPLERKTFNGRLEDRGVYSRRKFCDMTCAGAASQTETPALATLRKRHLPHRGTTCQQCGSLRLVSLHHVDGDPSNNDTANVMTLCGACHTKWHWQHGKAPMPKAAVRCVVCGKEDPNRIRRGMCQMHYQRWKKYGDPQADRPPLR